MTTATPPKQAPHRRPAAGDWTPPVAKEQAVFPTAAIRAHKYWPPVERVDNAYGDRHLVCACPPTEEYRQVAE